MASTSDPKVFHGQEATVEIGDALGSVASGDPLDGQLSSATDLSGTLMDITITDPEASVEVQNTFGGQVKTETPFELVTVDFTFRFRDTTEAEQLFGSTTYSTNSTTWTRISGQGDANIGSRPNKAILFKLEKSVDGTDYQINYLLNNAIFQQMGEISLEGDGTAEMTGTAVALIEDRYMERNF